MESIELKFSFHRRVVYRLARGVHVCERRKSIKMSFPTCIRSKKNASHPQRAHFVFAYYNNSHARVSPLRVDILLHLLWISNVMNNLYISFLVCLSPWLPASKNEWVDISNMPAQKNANDIFMTCDSLYTLAFLCVCVCFAHPEVIFLKLVCKRFARAFSSSRLVCTTMDVACDARAAASHFKIDSGIGGPDPVGFDWSICLCCCCISIWIWFRVDLRLGGGKCPNFNKTKRSG